MKSNSASPELQAARARTDDLFSLVQSEALYERPIPERHRLIFYLGHLEAFDWNLLAADRFGPESASKAFDGVFAFGIDPTDGNLPQDRPEDWPAPAEIRHYSAVARERIDRHLENESNDTLVAAATEHRLMHAETLAYLLHALPLAMKQQPRRPMQASDTRSLQNSCIDISSGSVTLGKVRGSPGFGWDNEFEAHTASVPAFSIQKYKVTNAQYRDFVTAGGYEDALLWSPSGWEWIRTAGIRHPRFWKREGAHWHYRTMFAELPLPPNWPVYVSYAEAAAYARWLGKQLPTEAQYHRAAFGTPDHTEERRYPWGSVYPQQQHGNFDCRDWDPQAVDAAPGGDSAFGVSDLVGNGWEWTRTPFEPFPGFQPFDFYRNYSAPFFDEKHYVLKGGSARTAATLLRRSFRNWFQPFYPNIYAGFRCVDN